MRKEIEAGYTVAFTIDGPRGPRFVTKPGPVLLARSSRVPMAVFHIAIDRAWTLNTWDRLLVPKPFSRALMRVGSLIPVPEDMPSEQLEHYNALLQSSLDRVKAFAEENVQKVGRRSSHFSSPRAGRDVQIEWGGHSCPPAFDGCTVRPTKTPFALTSPRIPIKFPEHIFSALSNFGSRISARLGRNWEAGVNPALPRNC